MMNDEYQYHVYGFYPRAWIYSALKYLQHHLSLRLCFLTAMCWSRFNNALLSGRYRGKNFFQFRGVQIKSNDTKNNT